jgi:hypothetical protein
MGRPPLLGTMGEIRCYDLTGGGVRAVANYRDRAGMGHATTARECRRRRSQASTTTCGSSATSGPPPILTESATTARGLVVCRTTTGCGVQALPPGWPADRVGCK